MRLQHLLQRRSRESTWHTKATPILVVLVTGWLRLRDEVLAGLKMSAVQVLSSRATPVATCCSPTFHVFHQPITSELSHHRWRSKCPDFALEKAEERSCDESRLGRLIGGAGKATSLGPGKLQPARERKEFQSCYFSAPIEAYDLKISQVTGRHRGGG